jgi:hypothetical protein
MKRLLLGLLLFVAAVPARAQDLHDLRDRSAAPLVALASDSIAFAAKVATGNLVGVTVTNYGFVGNNFISRDPSLEYPLGAGYEHLVRGGLWIGGIATTEENGTFTGVVTGALDGSQGSASQGATEFTPAGRTIGVRSSLANNEFFNRSAVSELDFLADYSDRPAKRSDNNGEDHRPMNLLVHQQNYAWSFSDFAHTNFFHFQIINTGQPLQNVWVGYYTEFASGNKKAQSIWPASGWFNKKWIACDDTLTMKIPTGVRSIPALFREHYCAATPIPTNCNLEVAPYWIGLKLLGWKRSRADTVVNKRTTLAAWRYAPGSALRNEDVERYAIMSTGTIVPTTGDSLIPGGDPVALLAAGPFSQIDPGDTISVDFALVGGAEIRDIQEHSRFAQRAFDRNYIVPIPPPSPRLKVVARHNALDLYWENSPESATDPTSPIPQDFEGYRVWVGDDRLDLKRVAQFDLTSPPHDTTGFNTGLSAVAHDTTIAGVPYHYRYTIDHLRDGFKYFVAVSSYDLGNIEIESLDSGVFQNKTLAVPAPAVGERVGGNKVTVFPNPYRVEARWDQGQKVRDHYLWFANLPPRATIKIFTLSGDVVFETDFDGATYHGTSARGLFNPRTDLDVDPPSLSGRTFGWNMITRGGQAVATGLYMFSVEDKATGDRQRGKFLIVKSDREDF